MRRRNGQLLSGKKEATNSLWSASLATKKKIWRLLGSFSRCWKMVNPLRRCWRPSRTFESRWNSIGKLEGLASKKRQQLAPLCGCWVTFFCTFFGLESPTCFYKPFLGLDSPFFWFLFWLYSTTCFCKHCLGWIAPHASLFLFVLLGWTAPQTSGLDSPQTSGLDSHTDFWAG